MLRRQYQGGSVPQGHILAKYRWFKNWTKRDKRRTKDLMKFEVPYFIWFMASSTRTAIELIDKHIQIFGPGFEAATRCSRMPPTSMRQLVRSRS